MVGVAVCGGSVAGLGGTSRGLGVHRESFIMVRRFYCFYRPLFYRPFNCSIVLFILFSIISGVAGLLGDDGRVAVAYILWYSARHGISAVAIISSDGYRF